MKITVKLLVAAAALTIAAGSGSAFTAKQKEYIDSSYRQCMSTDAKMNIEWLSMFGLKKSALKSFCRCQSEYVARYIDTDQFFTELTVSQIKCVKRIGGRVP